MTARHILLDRHFLRNGFRGLPPFHRGMRSLLSAMHELQTPIESSRLPIAVAVSGSGCNGDVSVVLTATTPTRAHTHTHGHVNTHTHTPDHGANSDATAQEVAALAFSFSFSRMAVPIASSLRQFALSPKSSTGLEGSLVLVSLVKASK